MDIVALHPALGDLPLTLSGFLAKGKFFLAGAYPPDIFLELCDIALEHAVAAQNTEYEQAARKYRYLAYMKLDRYYEAQNEAAALLGKFRDEMLHCQMMCSISMRRMNYPKALHYVNRLVSLAEQSGLDTDAYAAEYRMLHNLSGAILICAAAELAREIDMNGQDMVRRLAGRPLLITGMAHYVVDPATGNPFIIFNTESNGINGIFCQTPRSEIPFMRHVKFGREQQVMGYMLAADKKMILINPGCVLT